MAYIKLYLNKRLLRCRIRAAAVFEAVDALGALGDAAGAYEGVEDAFERAGEASEGVTGAFVDAAGTSADETEA